MQQEYDLSVHWRPFPLHPDTPETGRPLHELFRTTPEKIAMMIQRLEQTASALGLPFGPRTNTYNSRLAQELGLWAESKGRGHDFHMAAFQAYFADGSNLAKREVLLDLATGVGLESGEAAHVIDSRSWREAVDRDWQRSGDLGIRAVPTFVMDTRQVVGAQSYETLADLVRQGGVKRRGG